MSADTMSSGAGPGRVAILGAGPIGLDAALACSDAGWDFTVYEAGDSVAGHVCAWQHARMFTPWSLNVSPRMREHLVAAAGASLTATPCRPGQS